MHLLQGHEDMAVLEKDPSTRKICLVSTSEIKAGKEQFDHEVCKGY